MAGVANSLSSSEDLTQEMTATVDPVNILLEKRKCELMYELKNLQHGERPVTGSESKEKVGDFFTKRANQQHTPVANVDDVEEHRPQQVTIEVQGLLQNRSVSSILQSERFRRSLENVVRSRVIGSTTATPLRTVSRRQRAESSPAPPTPTESTIPPPPPVELPSLQSLSDSEASINLSISSQPARESADPPQRPYTPEEVLRRWNQDDFVMEISELVHRQLVTSTLHGPFRNSLERHVEQRVASSGHDARAVQEQILRLPPSNIRHNDFSHLGIPSPHDQQQHLDDTVSVISATASATIPFAQSNAAVTREMSAMKAQIAQLSNMLKTSLDLQMDIQRSIRQEVAAAVSQANSPNSTTGGSVRTAVGTQYSNKRANDSKCIICLEDDADSVFYRCGHLCTCYSCALRMKSTSGNCPVCRAPINDILRAYRISNEQ